MTTEMTPSLPTIPTSPNDPEESDVLDDGPTSSSDEEGEFGRVTFAPAGKAPDSHHRGGDPNNASQQQQYMDANASMMSTGTQWGSWYFQPQPPPGSVPGSVPGSMPPGAVMGPGGQPLPPHLAYWMQQGSMSLSELTYGPSYGQAEGGAMAAAAMSGIPEGRESGGSQQQQQDLSHLLPPDDHYKVYDRRWIMLFYMSILNLLSDWTCYSVAPIAMLTQRAFGDVDPESLVTVFLGANAFASALEPATLGRLGLRRTVLFGSLLLTVGSVIKSGGFRAIFMGRGGGIAGEELSEEEERDETWRLYLGFFLVGLSQPLYQCTPALLSASWFPENERTMATGVALNSNQLGIGCAFVFGTLLVSTEEDIIPYFGLLSMISTLTFIGTALQFEDAPPTPPSDTARVMKGDLVIKIPKLPFGLGGGRRSSVIPAPTPKEDDDTTLRGEAVAEAPAPASGEEPTEVAAANIRDVEREMLIHGAAVGAPSPAPTDDPVLTPGAQGGERKDEDDAGPSPLQAQANHPLQTPGGTPVPVVPPYPNYPYMPPPGYYPYPPAVVAPYPGVAPGMEYSSMNEGFVHGYDNQGHYRNSLLVGADGWDPAGADDGAEPIMTQMDHQLDIDIRDDQLVQQFRACFRRKGFAHCVVAFTTSGIIVNTLSTFMDYLVTLDGAPAYYVGVVGGTFQACIMCASLLFGGWVDGSRKYYFVTLAMLIFGAFALAVCNVNLDSNAGGDLRLNLIMVGILAGPLQPISTELGVEVVYPLSENTVLVIQQLFSNLLSAAFIPVFKALRDLGKEGEIPQYTFSFYMLIIIHAASTCYFATFNGKYLRHEAELEKKAKKEEEKERLLADLHREHGGYGSVEHN